MRRGLVLLVLAVVAVPLLLACAGWWRLTRPVEVKSGLAVTTPGDAAAGERLARSTLICTECHGDDLGGKVVTDDPAFGRIVAPNLTARARTAQEWDLAIRHGVGTGEHALILMPADGYSALSAEDLRDLIAWLDGLPRVDRALPPTRLGPIAAILVFTGKLHVPAWTIEHERVVDSDTPRVASERGLYLIEISGCRGCHGAQLEGHAFGPGQPVAPPLTAAALAGWSLEGFKSALRTGVARDGHTLDPMMPWRSFAAMPDEDVEALWQTLSRQP